MFLMCASGFLILGLGLGGVCGVLVDIMASLTDMIERWKK